MRFYAPRWIFWVTLVGATSGTTFVARAQPDVRDHRAHGPPASPPTEAPPPPREEKFAARAGFVWITGHWDWRGKWEWVPGHWERERAGKKWREGRWDKKDNTWVYVGGEWVSATEPAPTGQPPPPPTGAPGTPTEAPPPPREEKMAARKGFVWIAGQWDWRNNKWEWVAGHWERERAGKRWRASRWEQRDGRWARVEGVWEDEGATTPPSPEPPPVGTNPPGPPPMGRPHHEWRLDRPVVSSYWPSKGKIGTRIVIRGRNFPADTQVLFGGQPIMAAKIKPDTIMFQVPTGVASGAIELKAGRGRPLAVGAFEIAAAFDPVAEQKRLEEERRKAAEAAWAARQRELAKDRAAREAEWQRRRAEREANREQRRAERIAQLQAKWERAFLADQDTQDELTLHAQRVAELERMAEIAELSSNGKLAVRVGVARTREDDRHEQRMVALKASFKGGQP